MNLTEKKAWNTPKCLHFKSNGIHSAAGVMSGAEKLVAYDYFIFNKAGTKFCSFSQKATTKVRPSYTGLGKTEEVGYSKRSDGTCS